MELPKVEIKKILYATDLSVHAREAFAYAVSMANKFNASISILHTVIDVPNFNTYIHGYIDKEKWDAIKEQQVQDAKDILIDKKKDIKLIKDALNAFCEDAKARYETTPFDMNEIIVNRGNPVDEIIKQSENTNCDLIIMGSHGHGKLADALVGSTAMRVVRRSKIPVLLVRLPE